MSLQTVEKVQADCNVTVRLGRVSITSKLLCRSCFNATRLREFVPFSLIMWFVQILVVPFFVFFPPWVQGVLHIWRFAVFTDTKPFNEETCVVRLFSHSCVGGGKKSHTSSCQLFFLDLLPFFLLHQHYLQLFCDIFISRFAIPSYSKSLPFFCVRFIPKSDPSPLS